MKWCCLAWQPWVCHGLRMRHNEMRQAACGCSWLSATQVPGAGMCTTVLIQAQEGLAVGLERGCMQESRVWLLCILHNTGVLLSNV